VTWICPYCGAENFRMPVNSRVTPECIGCGKDYNTPEGVEIEIAREKSLWESEYKSALHERQNARDHISSLEDELSSWNIKLKDSEKDVSEIGTQLGILENQKIFREVDRVEKAKADPYQKQLCFGVTD